MGAFAVMSMFFVVFAVYGVFEYFYEKNVK